MNSTAVNIVQDAPTAAASDSRGTQNLRRAAAVTAAWAAAVLYWTLAAATAVLAVLGGSLHALALPDDELGGLAGTALCALLVTAATAARREDGVGRLLRSATPGGVLARLLLPAALLLPLACTVLTAHELCALTQGNRQTLAVINVLGTCVLVSVALGIAQFTQRRCAVDTQSAARLRRELAAHEDALAQATGEVAVLAARFERASCAAGVGVFEVAAGGAVVWWSEVMFDIFGWRRERNPPSAAAWADAIHPDDRARVLRLTDIAARARTGLDVRYRIVRPDGAIRHVCCTSSSAADRAAVGGRRIGTLIDATERVDAEQRERQLELQLRRSSHQAGIAETANSVLQNVELVLSGVGVAASLLRRDLTALRPERVEQVANLISSNRADMAAFLVEDVRGKYLPDYLLALAGQLKGNTADMETRLGDLDRHTTQLRDMISAQQSLIPMGGAFEPTELRDLVEAALLVQAPDFGRVEIVRRFADLPLVRTDRHKLLQIIVCFVSNARDALLMSPVDPPRLEIRISREADDAVVSIEDSGPGMSADTLAQLWQFGFTTKLNGHGFGLYSSATAAREIGASLSAHSDGPGRGACFRVRLPLNR